MQLLLLYMLLALGISFFCSIAESVLLSVPPSYIAYLRQQGRSSAALLTRLKQNIDRPLAAILSLNTIANTAGAAGVGAQAAKVFGEEAVGITAAILTFLILICSEIIPKTLGSVYWRQLAPPVAGGVRGLMIILYPLVVLSERLTRMLAQGRTPHVFRREEFHALAQLGAERGHLSAKEYKILGNLLRFRTLSVHDVMTPRTVLFALQEKTPAGAAFKDYRDMPFTRIPVYGISLDNITGFVLKTDILTLIAEGRTETKLADFKRELEVLPQTSTLFNAFEFLVDHQEHIALVVDEFGGVEGIVTLEDVVETLLGLEIVDEADVNVDMQELARTRWQKHAHKLGFPAEQEETENNKKNSPLL